MKIFNLLLTSLRNLSENYDVQRNKHPEYVDFIDELLTDFENSFYLLPQIMEGTKIEYCALISILRCYNSIKLNLTMEDRLSEESFKNDECWNSVRLYAKNAVKALGVYDKNRDVISN